MSRVSSKRMPLAVRMALVRNERERAKLLPPPILPCKTQDAVIIAYEGAYMNGIVVDMPWYSDDERYKRVRLEDGRTVRVNAHQIVKVEG